jgi:dephospho-CoA kinase
MTVAPGGRPGEKLRIGLTGGIASGKTAVADLFAARGVPVIDTDEIARDVVQPGAPALGQLLAAFSSEILAPDGTLDRKRLRARVFSDPQARAQLEQILHPAIRAEVERRAARAAGPYQVIVIPLLVETSATYVDRVLVVDCSAETQLRRLLARDAESEQQARAMLAAQATREQRLQRADDVILNEGELTALAPQVDALHAKYLALSGA